MYHQACMQACKKDFAEEFKLIFENTKKLQLNFNDIHKHNYNDIHSRCVLVGVVSLILLFSYFFKYYFSAFLLPVAEGVEMGK